MTRDICLSSHDELISVSSSFHPLPNPLFGGSALTKSIAMTVKGPLRIITCGGEYSLGVSSIDEISAGLKICIEELEAPIFIHSTHAGIPFVANVHGTKNDGRRMNGCIRGELAMTAEFSQGFGGLCKPRC